MTKLRKLKAAFMFSLMMVAFIVAAVIEQPLASAAVGIGVTGGCTQTLTNTNTCTITMSGSLTSGRTVVVGVGTPGARTVSSITGGGTYTKRNSVVNTVDAEIWSTTVGGGTGGTSSVVVTMSGNGRFVAWATEYTGVTFFGPTFPTATGSSANPSQAYTLDDGNDWFVANFVNTGTAPTAGTGNLRDARAATGVSQGYVDNTNANPVSVTDSVTHTATAWASVGIELVAASACSRTPTFSYASGSAVTFHPVAPWNDNHATAADGQGAGTPAMTVTNTGPGACNIGIKRNSAAPTGVEDQWNTINTAPNSGTNDVTLSNVVVCSSVAQAGTCTIYMWSRVGTGSTGSLENTYVIQQG